VRYCSARQGLKERHTINQSSDAGGSSFAITKYRLPLVARSITMARHTYCGQPTTKSARPPDTASHRTLLASAPAAFWNEVKSTSIGFDRQEAARSDSREQSARYASDLSLIHDIVIQGIHLLTCTASSNELCVDPFPPTGYQLILLFSGWLVSPRLLRVLAASSPPAKARANHRRSLGTCSKRGGSSRLRS